MVQVQKKRQAASAKPKAMRALERAVAQLEACSSGLEA